MKCKDIKELLSAYADGEVNKEQTETIEGHLGGCAMCRETLAGYTLAGERLASVTKHPGMPDRSSAILAAAGERETTARKQPIRWLRPALIGVPVMAVMILLAVLQPWVPGGGGMTVMAMEQLIEKVKINTTLDGLYSCRVTVENPIIPGALREISVLEGTFEAEFDTISNVHLTVKSNQTGKVNEFIFITTSASKDLTYYYLTDNDMSINYTEVINITRGGFPTKARTLDLLGHITNVQQLPDEVIDGVHCVHYKAVSEGCFYALENTLLELWIGKDDLIIRQISQKFADGEMSGNESIIKYSDFNVLPDIKIPVSSDSKLLAGWETKTRSPYKTLPIPEAYIIEHDTCTNPYYAIVTFPTEWLYEPPKESEWGIIGSGAIFPNGIDYDKHEVEDLIDILNAAEFNIENIVYDVVGNGHPAIFPALVIQIGKEESTAFFNFTDTGYPGAYIMDSNGNVVTAEGVIKIK